MYTNKRITTQRFRRRCKQRNSQCIRPLLNKRAPIVDIRSLSFNKTKTSSLKRKNVENSAFVHLQLSPSKFNFSKVKDNYLQENDSKHNFVTNAKSIELISQLSDSLAKSTQQPTLNKHNEQFMNCCSHNSSDIHTQFKDNTGDISTKIVKLNDLKQSLILADLILESNVLQDKLDIYTLNKEYKKKADELGKRLEDVKQKINIMKKSQGSLIIPDKIQMQTRILNMQHAEFQVNIHNIEQQIQQSEKQNMDLEVHLFQVEKEKLVKKQMEIVTKLQEISCSQVVKYDKPDQLKIFKPTE